MRAARSSGRASPARRSSPRPGSAFSKSHNHAGYSSSGFSAGSASPFLMPHPVATSTSSFPGALGLGPRSPFLALAGALASEAAGEACSARAVAAAAWGLGSSLEAGAVAEAEAEAPAPPSAAPTTSDDRAREAERVAAPVAMGLAPGAPAGRLKVAKRKPPPGSSSGTGAAAALFAGVVLVLVVLWRARAAAAVSAGAAKAGAAPGRGGLAKPKATAGAGAIATAVDAEEAEDAYDTGGSAADALGDALEPAAFDSMEQPEFVYAGTWGATQKRAAESAGAPTKACHATTLLHLAGGGVMMAWFGGSYESAEDVGIWVATRTHGAWSKPSLAAKVHRNVPYNGKGMAKNGPYNVAEPPRKGGEPHWNPVLWCADAGHGGDGSAHGACAGRIILYFKVGWRIHQWQTFVTQSDDRGATWARPEELIKGDVGGRGPVKNKPIVLQDGTWLAPASLEAPMAGRRKAWRGFTDRSTDGGRTWKKSNEVMPEDIAWGVIQPTLWEQPAGHVHMLLRSSKGRRMNVWKASSKDGGKTWAPPQRTSLPNNNSGLDVVRLRSGTLVLVYNHATAERTPLRVAVSTDNGATWPVGWDVETEPGIVKSGHEYSYPSIVAWPTAEGEEEGVSISYTWHRRRPAFLSVSLADLLKHATPTAEASDAA